MHASLPRPACLECFKLSLWLGALMRSLRNSPYGRRQQNSQGVYGVRERFRRFQHDWAEDYARVNGLKTSEVIRALSELLKEEHKEPSAP